MGTSILGIGQSALAAAQLGIATTGHNIANATTPGYNRQILLQTANAPQSLGGSFVGQGVQAGEIQRVYDQFVNQQVNSTQSTKNYAETYSNQIQQISNLIADPTAGVSPALQEFFNAVQNLATSPSGTAGAAARQSVLSSGAALTSRLQGLQGRLDQLREGVNNHVEDSIGSINSYSSQISKLNDIIEKAQSVGGAPNDLLDQRDNLVTELSKLVNITVTPQGAKLNVYMGSGQPLVLGERNYQLQTTASLTDPTRIEVAYQSNGASIQIAENSITGGQLGGLFAFRANTLDVSQNSLGRVAIGLASAFNEQHKLGQDLNGQVGGNFFNVGTPASVPSSANTTTANIAASISDVGALTISDYRVQFIGGNYKITRVSDGVSQTSSTLPLVIDGVSFNLAPPPAAATPANGDEFLVHPTANGASQFGVAVSDTSKIAAGSPVSTSTPSTNTGTGATTFGVINSLVATKSTSATATIGAASTDDSYSGKTLTAPVTLTFASGNLTGFPATAPVSVNVGGVITNYAAPATVPYSSGATISFSGISFSIKNGSASPANADTFTLAASLPITPATLTYNSAANTLSGFPANANVTVKVGNSSTTYVAGSAIPYTEGATISYQGTSFVISGTPKNADVFNISRNSTGSGDNRNALLLSNLQTQNSLVGNSTSFQGAYGQFVSLIGNKAHEIQITFASETKLLSLAIDTQQSVSGVNLDEEAANLLRYQQAYQAAGKLMQIASTLFDALLQLGR
ncbi:MAG: flagellar hook-associated protein FlgK [Cytophaga sp.]|nr:flagellar hook-associated protein FlgK [Undibacterium sp.]